MRVLKFGGTSVANADRLRIVSDIIKSNFERSPGLCAIVSAFSGITDSLIDMTNAAKEQNGFNNKLQIFSNKVNEVASDLLSEQKYMSIKAELDENHKVLNNLLFGVELIQEASKSTRDYILSFGERNCAFILSHYLQELGLPAEYVDARKFVKTDDRYGGAKVNFELTDELINTLDKSDKIYIVTGFIGSDVSTNKTTTLGRGGSDYSAAIFAAALQAESLDIWTDVDGVLTTDPRKVKKAYSIPELSYQEAMEMSHFGAKVLYAPTIRPVREKNIPTRILNTFNVEHPGTLISNNKNCSGRTISGLSAIDKIALLTLEGSGMQGQKGIASRFFGCLANGNINVIMITQASSEYSISIAIMENQLDHALALVNEEFTYEIQRQLINPLKTNRKVSLVAIIGDNMRHSPGVAGKLFNTLGKNGINIEAIAQGSSELNITFAINNKQVEKALIVIHDAFFLSEHKTVHLFMIGMGLIGSTLLEQIEKNFKSILSNSGIEMCLCGISNSRKMLIGDQCLSLVGYKDQVEENGTKADVKEFVDQMIKLNLPNSIFIDSTANADLPKYYEQILKHNIGVSTPNKIALSSGLENYHKLKETSQKYKTPFQFETNVGAGLPVISTLQNLINSGDRVHKIEAVLSGSLSYIFNTFNSEVSFDAVVKEAQEKGFTEPDPRDDLSGSDVKRKLLILSREAGYNVEDSDIKVNGFLSNESINASSVDAFYKALKEDRESFTKLVSKSEKNKGRLRFIAEFENGVGSISLKEVSEDSPFYALSGSDNMIVFTTDRYNSTPLVIRGPGAGADVTAAGVLSEIINMGKNI